MKRINILLICTGMLFGIQNIFGQDPTNPLPDYVYKNEQKRSEMDKVNGRNRIGMIKQPVKTMSPAEREILLKKQREAEEEKRTIIEEINQKLSTPPEYRNKYAEFLQGKNTGIVRMLPDKECDKGRVVSVEDLEKCGNMPQIKGAGSLYSFRLNELPEDLPLDLILIFISKSDIRFVGDRLLVGNSETQDIISEIGQIDITTIDDKFDALKFLNNFKPGKTKAAFTSQRQEIERGINNNGYLYSASAPVKINSSYILRSIAYYPLSKNQAYKSFWNTDLLVAFQIVGQEKDGSIIIIWKKLKQRDAPLLRT